MSSGAFNNPLNLLLENYVHWVCVSTFIHQDELYLEVVIVQNPFMTTNVLLRKMIWLN